MGQFQTAGYRSNSVGVTKGPISKKDQLTARLSVIDIHYDLSTTQ